MSNQNTKKKLPSRRQSPARVASATPPASRKTFILDTNVLLSDVDAIDAFSDNDVVIPLAVLEELDSNKKRMDDVGRNARAVCRKLDALRELGSLHKWVPLPNGGRLCVMSSKTDAREVLPPELQSDKNDNLIIAAALAMKKSTPSPILVSKDINVRVKCDALGVVAQDYLKRRAADQAENLYTGVLVADDVDDETVAKIWMSKRLFVGELEHETQPNQIVVIPRKDDDAATTILRRVGNDYKLVKEHHDVFGLEPRNKEQNFALDLLLDPKVNLVTLVGAAGCGKTLIALAAGLQQTLGSRPMYDKLVVTRPIEPLGRDLGYLPGTLEEKMSPWIAPIKDNLAFLISKGKKGGPKRETDIKNDPYINLLFAEGKIEIEAVTYIRGRSIPNSFIIIDEAQNLTVHQLKTIITRAGENTKIVLCGDIHQIDASHMDAVSNGLSYVVEAFKGEDMAGHVTLLKGERSALATRAADLL